MITFGETCILCENGRTSWIIYSDLEGKTKKPKTKYINKY